MNEVCERKKKAKKKRYSERPGRLPGIEPGTTRIQLEHYMVVMVRVYVASIVVYKPPSMQAMYLQAKGNKKGAKRAKKRERSWGVSQLPFFWPFLHLHFSRIWWNTEKMGNRVKKGSEKGRKKGNCERRHPPGESNPRTTRRPKEQISEHNQDVCRDWDEVFTVEEEGMKCERNKY
ncbi:hypothetical protein C8F04DRAFT_1192966 [Mycena alexandri]|uniref:Uncharacterized protein n=1 Tax=Mycena alexandri TaxID=1745969 RepID=A0AAD6SA41_9AGAR|nr:hypothetical protein C8F04DRAFT_1192966 [Mycena alexandri]